MQSRTLQRGRSTAPSFNIHSALPCHGMLLALDGRHLDRTALPLAIQVCRPVGKRLDILLVNPAKPATLLLWPFLQELEREGIDYRLTSCEGELADEVVRYVHRFRHISCILLDRLDSSHAGLRALRQEGYEVLTLREEESVQPHSSAHPGRHVPVSAGSMPKSDRRPLDDCHLVSRVHAPTLHQKHVRTARKSAVVRLNFTARYSRLHPLQS